MQAEQRYNTPGSLELTILKMGNENVHRHNFSKLEKKIHARDGVVLNEFELATGKRIEINSIARIEYNDNGRIVYPSVEGAGLKSVSIEVVYLEGEDGRFYASIDTKRNGVDHQRVWHQDDDFGSTPGEQVLLEGLQVFLDSLANDEYRR